jgi:AAA domain, putative AbiEii toxin, Type IV TA system/AAA ATPase domain
MEAEMRLLRARVQNFKSIEDSGWVGFDRVTCLVGKNESGKTAFLDALRKLKPVAGHLAEFDYELEYPRRHLQRYKHVHTTEPAVVVHAVYDLDDAEVAAVETEFGAGAISNREITVTKNYVNEVTCKVELFEPAIVRHLVTEAGLAGRPELIALGGVDELREHLRAITHESPQAARLLAMMADWPGESVHAAIASEMLWPAVPEFFYFDDYSIMRGRIALGPLKERREAGTTDAADRTFLALLDLVGEAMEEFETLAKQERLVSSLEAAGNTISDEFFEYWSQNTDLRLEFKLLGPDPAAHDIELRSSNNLMVRIYNNRHRVSVIFDERSKGFVWFFSFLAYFSNLEQGNAGDLVLLLDEPGLGLHPSAQADLLRFIEDKLAPRFPVVYTTHSPFMVDPTRLERVRVVEDTDEHGSRIGADVLAAGRDTMFPLQAALGYSLAEALVVGTDNLLVQGPAEYLYLSTVSQHLGSLGRTSLDKRWAIVPVGGLHNVPTFLALLHSEANLAVVVDGSLGGPQQVQNLVDQGLLDAAKLLPLTTITATNSPDIEDLFDAGFYLWLLERSGTATVAPTELGAGNRIVSRVEDALGGTFDHYRPARYLLEHPALLDELDNGSLARWELLIATINKHL